MHFKLIGCNVLRRELYGCAARSPHVVDVVMLDQGLHVQPALLREMVQREIDRPQSSQPQLGDEPCMTPPESDRPYDAILLGYALCSNGTVGLTAKDCPLVIPRAHDCISLMLGSAERYQQYFESHPGTYWYSSGWIETGLMPGKERYQQTLADYTRSYGDDNARYLMELEQDWHSAYQRAAYIDWVFPNSEQEKKFTRKCAAELNWEYTEFKGDPGWVQRLLDGIWNEKEFLVLKPGQSCEADPASRRILKARTEKA